MNGQVVVNSLRTHLLVNPCGDGGSSYQHLAALLLLQIKTAQSTLPNCHCPQRLHRSSDASGWYALGGGRTQRYLWPCNEQVYQVGAGVSGCLFNPRVQVWKKVIDVIEETHVRDIRTMCEAPVVINEAKKGVKGG